MMIPTGRAGENSRYPRIVGPPDKLGLGDARGVVPSEAETQSQHKRTATKGCTMSRKGGGRTRGKRDAFRRQSGSTADPT